MSTLSKLFRKISQYIFIDYMLQLNAIKYNTIDENIKKILLSFSCYTLKCFEI